MIGLLVDKLLNRSIGWSIDLKNSWSVNEKKTLHKWLSIVWLVGLVGWADSWLINLFSRLVCQLDSWLAGWLVPGRDRLELPFHKKS